MHFCFPIAFICLQLIGYDNYAVLFELLIISNTKVINEDESLHNIRTTQCQLLIVLREKIFPKSLPELLVILETSHDVAELHRNFHLV